MIYLSGIVYIYYNLLLCYFCLDIIVSLKLIGVKMIYTLYRNFVSFLSRKKWQVPRTNFGTRDKKLYIYFVPTHTKALLFACHNCVGYLYEPFVAEIRTAEIGIEARHGQDYPFGVLGFVGAVVGYKCMNDLVWNLFGRKRGDRLNVLGREVNFVLPQRAKL